MVWILIYLLQQAWLNENEGVIKPAEVYSAGF